MIQDITVCFERSDDVGFNKQLIEAGYNPLNVNVQNAKNTHSDVIETGMVLVSTVLNRDEPIGFVFGRVSLRVFSPETNQISIILDDVWFLSNRLATFDKAVDSLEYYQWLKQKTEEKKKQIQEKTLQDYFAKINTLI